ncbi:helix-turn-helix domain-containing protein [Kibdelosporangium phytohabitans]|uniref:HTH cro/C1-type domain-containing protein n=1 Tax=Kibdelosporangium phytohabitans TaxID=860235 RepID=A0A0N7F2U7_9PSEU|nr:helix-turn-helix domain-containing protein [Kibdelosporangium phytohabitans]ALG06823.1 hypothetical protein AOZ06_07675 [Kibdelosporangium phytohabitans]MBE1468066.1 transcriptional regulator with XRE-family HTH domain [Kibdelosporangium phytohabitans]
MNAVDRVLRGNLLRLRVDRRLTQLDVASQMQARGHAWHQPTVYKVEAGLRRMFVSEAVALAEVLGVDLDLLLTVRAPVAV